MKKQAALYFFGHIGRFRDLDNLTPCRFVLDGRIWRSAEHYYQAQKQQPNHAAVERIRAARTALDAKAMGYTAGHVDKGAWDARKYQVMQRAIWAKFSQNLRLKRLLCGTGRQILIEENLDDYTWGCGADGNGANWVGTALMNVRRNLQKKINQCPCDAAPAARTK